MVPRVARWHIFKTKIPNRVNFGGSCNGSCWYFYGHLVYFTSIWHILWPFGNFSHFGLLYQEKSGNRDGAPKSFFGQKFLDLASFIKDAETVNFGILLLCQEHCVIKLF
jgi:hypothetical protein